MKIVVFKLLTLSFNFPNIVVVVVVQPERKLRSRAPGGAPPLDLRVLRSGCTGGAPDLSSFMPVRLKFLIEEILKIGLVWGST